MQALKKSCRSFAIRDATASNAEFDSDPGGSFSCCAGKEKEHQEKSSHIPIIQSPVLPVSLAAVDEQTNSILSSLHLSPPPSLPPSRPTCNDDGSKDMSPAVIEPLVSHSSKYPVAPDGEPVFEIKNTAIWCQYIFSVTSLCHFIHSCVTSVYSWYHILVPQYWYILLVSHTAPIFVLFFQGTQ